MRRLSPAFLIIAFVGAILAFGNLIPEWEPVSKSMFYVFSSLFIISILFDKPPKNIF